LGGVGDREQAGETVNTFGQGLGIRAREAIHRLIWEAGVRIVNAPAAGCGARRLSPFHVVSRTLALMATKRSPSAKRASKPAKAASKRTKPASTLGTAAPTTAAPKPARAPRGPKPDPRADKFARILSTLVARATAAPCRGDLLIFPAKLRLRGRMGPGSW
jgi:hypothetical protein